MKITATFNTRSYDLTRMNLTKIAEKLGRTAKREAIAKAALPMLKRARANVDPRFTLLRKSLARRVRTYKNMVYVVVGPNRRIEKPKENQKQADRPVDYAHGVEFGTSVTPPRPFMRPAFEGGKKEAFDVFHRDLKAAVKRVANRYNRRHPVK